MHNHQTDLGRVVSAFGERVTPHYPIKPLCRAPERSVLQHGLLEILRARREVDAPGPEPRGNKLPVRENGKKRYPAPYIRLFLLSQSPVLVNAFSISAAKNW